MKLNWMTRYCACSSRLPVIDFSGASVSLNASVDRAAAAIVAADPKFPDGMTLKVNVEGGYEAHEHDAAAAATAILLEAAGTGRSVDPEVALLGGVDDKGRITGVNRLATRLRTLEGTAPPACRWFLNPKSATSL